MKNSQAPSKRTAFTLIEILVVVGIIALLAAILFPVFGRVKENARSTTCQNNLRQLGVAFQQYVQDYNKYPFAANLQNWADGGHWVAGGDGGTPKNYDGVTDPTGFGLAHPSSFKYVEGREAYPEKGALYQYVKETRVYSCPSAPDYDKKKLSYSMNCAINAIQARRIRTPAEIVLLVDEGDTINDGYFWAINQTSSTDALFKGHNGGGNILFADGHVKNYNFAEFGVDSSAAGAKLKWRGTGIPRFHDKSFGTNGSNTLSGSTIDYCNSNLSTPRDWTLEP